MRTDHQPVRSTRKTGQPQRTAHIDVRMTEAQKAAIERAALRVALDPSTWMRSIALAQTDWKPDEDQDFIAAQRKKTPPPPK